MLSIEKIETELYKNQVKDINIQIGDIIKVSYQLTEDKNSIRSFTGICIKKAGRKFLRSILLRNNIKGVGVEFNFFIHKETILKIEQLKKIKNKKIKRAKLYYLREKSLSESLV